MRFKWTVLLLLLMLPIMIADIDPSLESPPKGYESSAVAIFQQIPRSARLKRGCCCGGGRGPTVVVVDCKKKATGQKEMLRNWWLHIPLLLLPMSVSWMKAPLS
ncbi:unnamed protein product [Onchocerca ochengi]|uniref:Uncharacterized protein n=1 Tax=Onchocerca ochengi TaxID=42157 RepID=A0A182EY17_ONCOC|nr:unnamed protein product [Onchocerca ochengi]